MTLTEREEELLQYFTSGSLTDTKVRVFRDLLQSLCVPNGGMNLAEFDGLVAACASGPEHDDSRSYFPLVYGMSMEDAQARLFASATEALYFHKLLWRRDGAIESALERNDFRAFFSRSSELLGECDDEPEMGYAERWCLGYLRGVVLRRREWELLLSEQGYAGISAADVSPRAVRFVRSYAAQCEQQEQVSQVFWDDPRRKELAVCLSDTASALYHWWAVRKLEPHFGQPSRAVLKIGRNDLCVCGSGKKYKRCCGNA